jgi:hypothetical protein
MKMLHNSHIWGDGSCYFSVVRVDVIAVMEVLVDTNDFLYEFDSCPIFSSKFLMAVSTVAISDRASGISLLV